VSLREELMCECGMNSRMRMIVSALEESPPTGRFLMLERVTPLFAKIRDRYPFVEGCEYFGEDVEPGSIQRIRDVEVRHENLLRLSYADRSFDFIFHGDVLEHVPDIRLALSECYRVLNRNGVMVFTCPMYNFENHIVRAFVKDGELVHILPPAYHGNPVDENGALVFTEPSLSLLEDMRAVGFDTVEMGLAFDPSQGILRDGNPYEEYNAWPVIFRATRRRRLWAPNWGVE
jgi:SAM-dependent methyltransferase